MIDQVRRRTGWFTLTATTLGEVFVMESMVRWATADGQTRQRVDGALAQFQRIRSGPPPWTDAMREDYAVERTMFSEALDWPQEWDDRARMAVIYAEITRYKRLQDFFFRDTVGIWDGYMDAWAADRPTPDVLTHGADNWQKWYDQPLLVQANREFGFAMAYPSIPSGDLDHVRRLETSRRATLIRLAYAAYGLQRGRPPEALEDLAPEFLARVPGVPGEGGPFTFFPAGWPVELLDPMLRPIPAGTPVLCDRSLESLNPSGNPKGDITILGILNNEGRIREEMRVEGVFFPIP